MHDDYDPDERNDPGRPCRRPCQSWVCPDGGDSPARGHDRDEGAEAQGRSPRQYLCGEGYVARDYFAREGRHSDTLEAKDSPG